MKLRCTTYAITKILVEGRVNTIDELMDKLPYDGYVIIDLDGFEKGFIASLIKKNAHQAEGIFVHSDEYSGARFRIFADSGELKLAVMALP